MKRSKLGQTAVLIAGALAACFPTHGRIAAASEGRSAIVEQSRASEQRTPSANVNFGLDRSALLNQFLGVGGPSNVTQFYRYVPRFRGYRNGRPRGRRSYLSHRR